MSLVVFDYVCGWGLRVWLGGVARDVVGGVPWRLRTSHRKICKYNQIAEKRYHFMLFGVYAGIIRVEYG